MAMKGECLSADLASLEKGREYFLFPLGESHYYVSKFDNINSHRGAYQKEYFRISAEEVEDEPRAGNYDHLDVNTVYTAELIWRRKGYAHGLPLTTYYIKPKNSYKTHCDLYKKKDLQNWGGCYPLHWFINIQELSDNQTEKTNELAANEWQQMSLF
ncbi:hypothetical protein [Bacillus atrophaeus]|uniref:hypothetical protein n=1 Tax=Bacillus atrophaeus TaxID=1452 RepID=UPI00240D0BC3|nr:hypothetical protein [Bacillus atrophaeus]